MLHNNYVLYTQNIKTYYKKCKECGELFSDNKNKEVCLKCELKNDKNKLTNEKRIVNI